MRCKNGMLLSGMMLYYLLSIVQPVVGGTLLQGDAGQGAAQSFTFPISGHKQSGSGDAFYVAAHPTAGGDTNDYAVSVVFRGQDAFTPLTPESALLNGESANPNPLFNSKIQLFNLLQVSHGTLLTTLYSQHPIVVTQADDKTLYVINTFSTGKPVSMASATGIKDAATPAVATGGIVGLAAIESFMFAAVKPGAVGGDFGDVGGGVAMLSYGDLTIGEGEDKKVRKAIAQNGTTAALNKGSDFVKITNDLVALGFKDMYWDVFLKRLYVAFDLTGAGAAGDGARALAVAYVHKNQVYFLPIVPEAVFVPGANDEIVGAIDAGAQLTMHKVRTMRTSTWLHYLIVVGGNGADTDKKVFALPLVNNPGSTQTNGTLAKFDGDTQDLFKGNPNVHAAIEARLFKDPATANGHILKMDDERAKIGGGDAPNTVQEIFVKGDVVFVVVGEDFTAGQVKKRLYYSRALFDSVGRVMAWTKWAPVHAAQEKVFGADIDQSAATVTTMSNDTGNDADGIMSVRRTVWGQGDEDGLQKLTSLLGGAFPKDRGGIHGLFDVPEENTSTDEAAFLFATGLQKVALVELGRGDPLLINKGDVFENVVRFGNGAVEQNFADTTRALVFSGGVLDAIGPIEVAALTDGGAGSVRVFVGGTDGLAALVEDDGSGTNQLDAGFQVLSNMDLAFKKVGDYRFVHKLVSDSDNLYVLTDTRLDRIDLTNDNLPATTIATIEELNLPAGGALLDVVVSGKLCLLATSYGLYRTGNGSNVLTAVDTTAVGWTRVALPEASTHVQQLVPLTKNGLPQGLQSGGNLNVLSAYRGKNKMRINRLTIKDVSAAQIDDDTVQSLPDGFVQTRGGGDLVPSYFASYGSFRNSITHQDFQFTSRERDIEHDPVVSLVSPWLRSGEHMAFISEHSIGLNLTDADDITRILRFSSSGDLFVALNSGVLVNE